MKKILPIALLSLGLAVLFWTPASAVQCDTPHVFPPPPAAGGITYTHADTAGSLVPCGQYLDCRCEFSDIFVLISRVYNFIVWTIAAPLAGFLIIAGGVIILASGANPNWYHTGKTMLWGAVIGLALIFGSWIIVNTLFYLFGYTGSWYSF